VFAVLGLAIGTFLYLGLPGLPGAWTGQPTGPLLPVAPTGAAPSSAPQIATATVGVDSAAFPPVFRTVATLTGIAGNGDFPGAVAATLLPTSTPGGDCGHHLDEPFGPGRQFVIHRVESGESLGFYEAAYATNAASIEAVNASPLTPLEPGRIIIIPLYQKAVEGVPPFEAFQVYQRDARVSRVAADVGASTVADFLFYNGYTFTQCPIFAGWVLSPRAGQRPTATPDCRSPDAQSAVVCYPTPTPTHKERGN